MRPENHEGEKKNDGMQPGWVNRLRQRKWKKSDFLLLALIGVLILVISLPTDSKCSTGQPQDSGKDEESTDRKNVESELEKILSKIEGAGKVEVMITYEDQGTSVVEKDESATRENSTEISGDLSSNTKSQTQRQEETVFDGEKQPFVVRELEPKIEGILVVAEGGDNAVVQKNISDAVMALFDVEIHKIKIVKMN